MNNFDQDVLTELSELIETLTTSGSQTLDEKPLKRVKSICKTSDENVRHLFRMVMTQLEKRHSEIRLSSLQIINEIFLRSHAFRELLVDDFQKFLSLTIGVNSKKALPEPKAVATILRDQAFKSIETWHSKYGLHYMKLALGYKYLKRVKKFNFVNSQSQSELERLRAEDAETRRMNLVEQKLGRVLSQMGESVEEIQNIIKEMGNCFCLVLPSPEEFDIHVASDESLDCNTPSTSTGIRHDSTRSDVQDSSSDDKLVDHGFSSCSFQLNIELPTSVQIIETTDNTDVLRTLRELHKQVSDKYLPLTQKWLEVLAKHSGHNENLVQAIDLKNALTELKYKFDKLKIVSNQNGKSASANSIEVAQSHDDKQLEDDFVDVPEKEGIEHIPDSHRHNYGLKPEKNISLNSSRTGKDETSNHENQAGDGITWNPHGNSLTIGDPSSRMTAIAALLKKHESKTHRKMSQCVSSSTITRSNVEPKQNVMKEADTSSHQSFETTKKRAELLKRAPVVPFGIDLYNWERKDEEAPSMSSVTNLHCYWAHPNEDADGHVPGDLKESMKSRSISFAGEFQEIKWACRAPLASGKLCPRRDRYKCPFHGKIIPRDAMGQPQGLEGNVSKASDPMAELNSLELDRVTRDIEQATGMDLGSKKEKKGKKRKHSGLTDLKKNSNTSRARLEKKVFNKAALVRVGEEMDRIKKSLVDEKFGNNWNYALKL